MRKWIITGAAAVAVLLLAFIAYGQFTKEDAYRLIKVLSVEGSATVTRESVGELDAYADMQLESGDELLVDGESSVILMLDNDKYVLLEPGTRLTLEAEGTSANSKTVIHLEEGAVVNQLVNKLNDESSYEVTVPNSTMAVRGTVFRVEIVYEDEHSYAYVTVLDGEVASRLIFPDGTVEDESLEWQIPKGSGVNVHGDEEISEYFPNELQEATLERFPVCALEFLFDCLERDDVELCFSREEIQEALDALKEADDADTDVEASPEAEEESGGNTDKSDTKVENKTTTQQNNSTDAEDVEADDETTSADNSSTGEASSDSSSDSDTSGGSSSSSSSDSSSSEDSSSGSSSSGSTTTTSYTVTFTYNNGETFCTQTVTSGSCATEPVLMPTASGSWYSGSTAFDFSTAITADTTLTWTDTSSAGSDS